MKLSRITLSLLVLSAFQVSAQELDRSIVPSPAKARTVQLPKAQEFSLENGLQVIVVENHKLPRVSFQLSLNREPISEGEMIGMLEMVGPMIKAGTEKMNKDQIDESIDFIGASLSFSSTGMYASSLKKHGGKLLELASDMLFSPTFPQDELDKLKKQAISGIQNAKNDAGTISNNVRSVLNYGTNHPYGEVGTESEIEAITVDAIRNYYNTYFKPNIAYLVIVGDISLDEAKTAVGNYFGDWKKGEIPKTSLPSVAAPKANTVAVVDKPGAVQSVISITYPLDLKPGNEDVLAVSVMNKILGGGGFSARLMTNLREDKAFTYGAYSTLSTDEHVGNFNASASVRTEVTDSAIVEFLFEMNRIRNEKVSQKDLDLIKNGMAGAFGRSLERPQTIAGFAYNIKRYGLANDHYATYLERLEKVSIEDVQRVAQKYIHPDKANILVVGNKEEITEKVGRFSSTNDVLFFDAFGRKETSLEPAPEGLTVQELMNNVIKATAQESKLKKALKKMQKVKSIQQTMEMEIAGAPMTMVMEVKKGAGLYSREIKAGGQTFQKTMYNGQVGKETGMMGNKTLDEKETEDLKAESAIFSELNWKTSGDKYEILGIDKGLLKVKKTDSEGESSFVFYDQETWLVKKSISTTDGPEGPITMTADYESYKDFGGFKMAEKVTQSAGPQTFNMKLTEVKINPKLDTADFE